MTEKITCPGCESDREDDCHYCGNNILANNNCYFVVAVYLDEAYHYCNPNCLALHFSEISRGLSATATGKDGENER